MTTVFEVRGGKVNTMIPINRINRMEIKLIRNIITDAKKHTELYELLREHLCPYITNKKLHGLHHPHNYQMKKVLNNIFACKPPKSSTYSTTMNMTTCIIIDMAFHGSSYEDIFKDLYIHLGVQISESLSLHL